MALTPKGARALALIPVLTLGFALAARTQSQPPAQGAVRLAGSIRTAQGISVPAASVRAENLASHQAWLTWTDTAGKFQFPALPPGRYRIEASMLGFTAAAQDFDAAGGSAALDLTLEVASLAILAAPAESAPGAATAGHKPTAPAAASPAGAGPRLAATGASATRVPAGVMNAIRSGMGGFQQVDVTAQADAEETPSAENTGAAGPSGPPIASPTPLGEASSSDAFLMNGSVGRGAAAMPGGGPMLGGEGGMAGGLPGQGIALSGEGAGGGGRVMLINGGPAGGAGRRQFGGPPPDGAGGGVVGLYVQQRLLRRQVNRIRFNLTDRYENSVWDARSYSLNGAPSAKIGHYDEHFGASAGGPLLLPHLYDGRDRTFFFVNYNLDRSQSPIDSYSTVPTIAERSGNFCDRNMQLFDPRSNPSGPRASLGCQIPAGMLDTAAAGLLQFIPPPNLPGLVQNFHLQTTLPHASDFVNAHVLHTISSKLSLNAGYNFQSTRSDTLANFPSLGGRSLTRNQNVDLALIQNWTSRLVHSTRLNFNRSRVELLSDHSFGQDLAAALGITGVSSSPVDFGVPQTSFTNFTGLADPIPSNNRNQTWRFDDSVTYSRARHTIAAGFEMRRMDWNKLGDPTPRGSFTFTGLMTGQLDARGRPVPGTGFDFADFLLGLPQFTNSQFGSTASYFRSWGLAGYAQDDWRIAPRFSVEYGLRYDFATPATELFNAIANLDLNPGISQAAVVIPGESGPFSGRLPDSLIRSDPYDFSPRLGFAWQPLRGDPLIVRGGYSIFYNESIYQQLAFDMANQPPFAQAQLRFTTPAEVLTLENGFPPQPPGSARNTIAVDPNYRPAYAQLWDLSLERQFRGGWVLNVYYTGTKGTHLDLQLAPNRAAPGGQQTIANASGFVYDTDGASSIYHAAHVAVRKRPTRGLMVLADYAFGKSIDNASTFGGGVPTVVQNENDFAADRGLSSFDIRHQLRGFAFYQLPFGTRQRWARGGWTERLFGNYRLSSVLAVNSGTPFTARVLGAQADNTGTGSSLSERADQIATGCAGPGATAEFFNTAAFTLPPVGQFGNAARNTICGPGLFNWNLSLDRSFIFGSDRQRRLDLRWDVTNLTNTPHWTGLNTVVNSATYGFVTSAGTMRTMALTARVAF